MSRVWLSLVVGAGCGLLLTACGESQDVPTRHNRSLGGVKEGAPLVAGVSDPGILQDAASYQPAKLPAGQTANLPRPGRPAVAAPVSDPASEARSTVAALVNAVKDGEVDLALRLFDAQQIKPLVAEMDVLYATFEKLDLLQRLLAEKFGAVRAERLIAELRGGADEPKTDILDAEHASVTPNGAALLLGADRASPSLQLVRQKNEWKFQLQAVLSDADVQAIKAYHEKLQAALDHLVAWIDATAAPDEAQVKAELVRAREGKPLSLSADSAADGAAKAGTDKKPAEDQPAPPARGTRP